MYIYTIRPSTCSITEKPRRILIVFRRDKQFSWSEQIIEEIGSSACCCCSVFGNDDDDDDEPSNMTVCENSRKLTGSDRVRFWSLN